MAVDPGVMTGYCYGRVLKQGDKLEYFPFQMTDDIDEFWIRMESFQPRYIIMEDFEFRMGQRYKGAGLNMFPMQLIGVARLYEMKARHQMSLYLQKASVGKQYYTDTMLKSLMLYKRGIPHGMDASRHLLQWFTFGAGYQLNNGKHHDFAKLMTEQEFVTAFMNK